MSACGCGCGGYNQCRKPRRNIRGATGATGATGSTGATGGVALAYLKYSGSGNDNGYLADSGKGKADVSVAEDFAFSYSFHLPITIQSVRFEVRRLLPGESFRATLVNAFGVPLAPPFTITGNGETEIPLTPFATMELGILIDENTGTNDPVYTATVAYT